MIAFCELRHECGSLKNFIGEINTQSVIFKTTHPIEDLENDRH